MGLTDLHIHVEKDMDKIAGRIYMKARSVDALATRYFPVYHHGKLIGELLGSELRYALRAVGYELHSVNKTRKHMNFGQAIEALKAGKKVAREGWNGKSMWLYLVPGSTFKVAEGRPLAAHIPVDTEVQYHAHIDMKTAQGYHVPWLASQADMLSEDWVIVE